MGMILDLHYGANDTSLDLSSQLVKLLLPAVNSLAKAEL